MEIQQFISHIAEQFDETDPTTISEQTNFKELEDYSSLTALNILSVIDDEYDVNLKGDDIRNSTTILDLFNLVKSKVG
jgi:acyl carrier protein